MNRLYAIIFLSFLLVLGLNAKAQNPQDRYPLITCDEANIHAHLVEANASWLERGKIVYFSQIQTAEKAYTPVALNLEAGKNYVVNLSVGDQTKQVEYRIIDTDKNELLVKKDRLKKQDSNISQSTIRTINGGLHWLILLQKTEKNANTCLGISIIELN